MTMSVCVDIIFRKHITCILAYYLHTRVGGEIRQLGKAQWHDHSLKEHGTNIRRIQGLYKVGRVEILRDAMFEF